MIPVMNCSMATKKVRPPKQNQKRRACIGTGLSSSARCSRSESWKRSSQGAAIDAKNLDIAFLRPPSHRRHGGDDDLAVLDGEDGGVHVADRRARLLDAGEREEARVARTGELLLGVFPVELARDVWAGGGQHGDLVAVLSGACPHVACKLHWEDAKQELA